MLLRRFREAENAILLGTDSFWEGVDVPGRALRALVLNKLPFKVPSEPLTAARLERLAEQGQDGFVALPAAPRGAQAEAGLRPADPEPDRRRRGGAARQPGGHQAIRARCCSGGCRAAERVVGTWAQVRTKCEDFFARHGIGAHRMTRCVRSKIVCIGRNYVAHARELGNEVPGRSRCSSSSRRARSSGTGDAIVLPPASSRGGVRGGDRRGDRAAARRTVTATRRSGDRAGSPVVNDVTCRDLQKTDGQWGRAKGFDTFCPVGPRGGRGAGLARPRGHRPGKRAGAAARAASADMHLPDSRICCRTSAAS